MSKMGRKRKLTGDTAKSLMKKAIAIHSLYIRERDGYLCFVCGTVGTRSTIDNGHLIPRGKKNVLFDDENCNAQCKGDNKLHNYEPHHYTQKWIAKYGAEKYADLVERSKILKQWKSYELQELIEVYTRKLAELKEGHNG
jgi:hypothetical protein